MLQGLYAIGSGGLLGKGLGQSIQKLSFLPEPQNDMIFAIICEELGLFGAISVILIFLFMIYRFMLIAGNAPDLFGALLVVGVMAHIAIQVILNIAVVTNVIPNTGITLPFSQLWRHLGAVPDGGDGHGSQRVQPDKAGEIRIRRNTGPVRCIGYCIACIWGDPFVCNTDPGPKALKGNRWDPGFQKCGAAHDGGVSAGRRRHRDPSCAGDRGRFFHDGDIGKPGL